MYFNGDGHVDKSASAHSDVGRDLLVLQNGACLEEELLGFLLSQLHDLLLSCDSLLLIEPNGCCLDQFNHIVFKYYKSTLNLKFALKILKV